MAYIDTSGMDQLIRQMQAYESGLDEATDDLLKEGGKIIAEAWKDAAEQAGHRDPSHHGKHMIDAIKAGKPSTDKDGYRKISVFPRGNYSDRRDKYGKPISFAKVAAILNYGRSDLKGSNFVKIAERQAGPRLEKLIQDKMDKYIKSKGLN